MTDRRVKINRFVDVKPTKIRNGEAHTIDIEGSYVMLPYEWKSDGRNGDGCLGTLPDDAMTIYLRVPTCEEDGEIIDPNIGCEPDTYSFTLEDVIDSAIELHINSTGDVGRVDGLSDMADRLEELAKKMRDAMKYGVML